jgi:hypothetical protein
MAVEKVFLPDETVASKPGAYIAFCEVAMKGAG